VDLADDSGLGIVLGAGILLAIGSVLLVWLATLRAAWLLGDSRRRSAVLAWFAGLWGTVRQPVGSLVTLGAWMAPGVIAAVVPTILGWRFEILREMVPGTVLGIIAGLVTAFCQVGLFLSFAPVSGSARDEGADQP
jgi:hypothetical protein